MNREIFFRGKRSNDRWVYGSLVVSENIKPAIYYEKGKGLAKQLDWCRFVVKYDERQAEFVAVNSTLPNGFGLPISQTWIDETNKIICGNIHDNPGLIK